MDTDIKKLKKMTRFMQKQKILSLKTSEIEIHLSPKAFSKEFDLFEIPEKDLKENISEPSINDEDMLLWSAPGVM